MRPRPSPLVALLVLLTPLVAAGLAADAELRLEVKKTFRPGGWVELSGLALLDGRPAGDVLVSIEVLDPEDRLAFVDVVKTRSDGRFETGFRLAEDASKGTYRVTATARVGGELEKAYAEFEVVAPGKPPSRISVVERELPDGVEVGKPFEVELEAEEVKLPGLEVEALLVYELVPPGVDVLEVCPGGVVLDVTWELLRALLPGNASDVLEELAVRLNAPIEKATVLNFSMNAGEAWYRAVVTDAIPPVKVFLGVSILTLRAAGVELHVPGPVGGDQLLPVEALLPVRVRAPKPELLEAEVDVEAAVKLAVSKVVIPANLTLAPMLRRVTANLTGLPPENLSLCYDLHLLTVGGRLRTEVDLELKAPNLTFTLRVEAQTAVSNASLRLLREYPPLPPGWRIAVPAAVDVEFDRSPDKPVVVEFRYRGRPTGWLRILRFDWERGVWVVLRTEIHLETGLVRAELTRFSPVALAEAPPIPVAISKVYLSRSRLSPGAVLGVRVFLQPVTGVEEKALVTVTFTDPDLTPAYPIFQLELRLDPDNPVEFTATVMAGRRRGLWKVKVMAVDPDTGSPIAEPVELYVAVDW